MLAFLPSVRWFCGLGKTPLLTAALIPVVFLECGLPPGSDQTAPLIMITSPTNKQMMATSTVTVSGIASDDVALIKVEVRVGAGAYQDASGTTSWSKSVTLAAGSNMIFAKATDTSGNMQKTWVTVTFGQSDLLAYWRFDENVGATAADSSGNGKAGAVNGAAWVPGRVGSALQFDGVDDYVDVGNALSVATEFTLSMWMKREGEATWRTLISKGESELDKDHNYLLVLTSDKHGTPSQLHFSIGDGANSRGVTTANSYDTSWHHLAVAFVSANDMRIYVDGVLQPGTYDPSGTAQAPAGNSKRTLIGAARTTGEFFNGIIDEVKIHKRALSSDEIHAEYDGGGSATEPTLPSAPQGVSASAGNTQITLTWGAPADGGSPITNYRIFRGESSGSEEFLIELGDVVSYSDTGLTNGVTYYFKVNAKNAVGEGPRSAEAIATPVGSGSLLWDGGEGSDWCNRWIAFNIPSTGYQDFSSAYPCSDNDSMSPFITRDTSHVRIGASSIKITLNDVYARSMLASRYGKPEMDDQSEEWTTFSLFFPAYPEYQNSGAIKDDWVLLVQWYYLINPPANFGPTANLGFSNTYDKDPAGPIYLQFAQNRGDITGKTGGALGGPRTSYGDIPPLQRDIWYDFLWHFHWSSTSNGVTEMWFKAASSNTWQKIFSWTGINLQFGTYTPTGQYWPPKIKSFDIGVYHGEGIPIHKTVFFDGLRTGATREDVVY